MIRTTLGRSPDRLDSVAMGLAHSVGEMGARVTVSPLTHMTSASGAGRFNGIAFGDGSANTYLRPKPMAIQQHLSDAPLVEAALDIRVDASTKLELEALGDLQARLPKRFVGKQLRMGWLGQVEFRPGAEPVTTGASQPNGYVFGSSDGKQSVIAELSGFTFSQLKPYGDWETFAADSRSAWENYIAVAKPRKVQRIALRYINRLEIPLPVLDFKDYLLTVPEIAPGLPQAMAEFFFRLVVPMYDAKATAIITETIDVAGVTPHRVPIVLDIDVFREGSFPIHAEKLWPMFEPLRVAKNRLFFGSITEKTVDLCK